MFPASPASSLCSLSLTKYIGTSLRREINLPSQNSIIGRYRLRRKSAVGCSITQFFSSQESTAPKSCPGIINLADATSSIAGHSLDLQILETHCHPPRSIFPWRHSSYPLPRLTPPSSSFPRTSVNKSNTSSRFDIKYRRKSINREQDEFDEYCEFHNSDYFTQGGHLGPGWPSPMHPGLRFALFSSSINLLGLPWWKIALPWTRKAWEMEMERSFCDAFVKGVKGMIDDTYVLHGKSKSRSEENDVSEKVKAKDIESKCDEESFEVDFDFTINPLPNKNEGENDTNDLDHNRQRNFTGDDEVNRTRFGRKMNAVNFNEESENRDDQYFMLQKNLRHLYQNAEVKNYPSKLNILLRVHPYSAQIESMFPVYGLTRSLVEDYPALRYSYRNLAQHLQQKQREAQLEGARLTPLAVGSAVINKIDELMNHTSQLTEDNKMVTTVIAQVSIDCQEIFYVRDEKSGEILQGFGDGQKRNVTHLVRFEIVVKVPSEGFWPKQTELGRWQITDWDDLLRGNVWFV